MLTRSLVNHMARSYLVLLYAALLIVPAMTMAQQFADSDNLRAEIAGQYLDISPAVEFEHGILTVSGPNGYILEQRIDSGGLKFFAVELTADGTSNQLEPAEIKRWDSLPGGKYTFEVALYADGSLITREAGSFHVKNGSISDLHMPSSSSIDQTEMETESGSKDRFDQGTSAVEQPNFLIRALGAVINTIVPSAQAQSLQSDTYVGINDPSNVDRAYVRYENDTHGFWRNGLIDGRFRWHQGSITDAATKMTLTGSPRLGLGTTNPLSAIHAVSGSSVTGIRLESTTATNILNSSSQGMWFVPDSGTVPFWVQNGAPSYSLVATSSGNIGMGTFTPADSLQITNTAPIIRFDDTDDTQVWRLLAGGGGYRVQDTTAGTVPFLIDTNAPDSALTIGTSTSQDGNVSLRGLSNRTLMIREEPGRIPISVRQVSTTRFIVDEGGGTTVGAGSFPPDRGLYVFGDTGIGTSNPATSLHIRRTDGTAGVLLEETQAIATNTMFEMRHNGNPGFRMGNTATSAEWDFRLGGTGSTEQFTINKTSIAGAELSVIANGNIRIKGNYLNGSSRAIKHDIKELDGSKVLDKLNKLSINEWRYDASPENLHAGPMAEDFYEVFGFGVDETSISMTDLPGVALAAVKELNARNTQLQSENAELEKRIERLEALVLERASIAQQ
jgi:hypothetical protein